MKLPDMLFGDNQLCIKKKGLDYFENKFLPKFNNITIVGLY